MQTVSRFGFKGKPGPTAYQPKRRKPGPFGSGIPPTPVSRPPAPARVIKLKRGTRRFGQGVFSTASELAHALEQVHGRKVSLTEADMILDSLATLAKQWNPRLYRAEGGSL